MTYRNFLNVFLFLCLGAAMLFLADVSGSANAKPSDPPSKVGCRGEKGKGKSEGKCPKDEYEGRVGAAARAYQKGRLNPLMSIAAASTEANGDVARQTNEIQAAAALIDGAPHYFSHPNYANSPLPEVTPGQVVDYGNPLVDRQYSSDTNSNILVVVPDPLPDGMIESFKTWNQPAAGGSPASAGLNFHAYVLRPTGNTDEYTVIFDSGQLTVPALADPNTAEEAVFPVANLAVQSGDLLAFYGQGVPVDVGSGNDMAYYPADTSPLQNSTITLGVGDFPPLGEARTYSFSASVFDLTNASINGGMRKFVDPLPQVGPDLPVAVADTSAYPGANYYEIALVQFRQQMHSDLANATLLRGYVQLTDCGNAGAVPLSNEMLDGTSVDTGYCGLTAPTYMGPAIVTEKDMPVRILFRNLLPTGAGGNLFIPVDSTVMGSGPTPEGHMAAMEEPPAAPWDDPQNPPCSGPDKDALVAAGLCFSDNRSIVHLHGGITPWISDGTPHQWITPANETTPYPQGVSVRPVPDMDAVDTGTPDDGTMTFYYTNQQSARLMFYHDHAWGITRLNVYAGMAAPYIITDATEQALVDGGIIPPVEDTIPLVVQDKTFVPSDTQLAWQDEAWDTTRWGGEGNLWVPHVYSPAQNPGDASGVNEYGRWAYGPWFWPPTSSIDHGPIANPYYDPACDPDLTWCEPPLMPGTPYNSMGMESFNDTPIVNGAAYPTITLEPKAYRFRILNAANDRFFNFSLYQAIDANGVLCDSNNPSPAPESTGITCTEVALNPDEVAAALDDPAGVFPTPVVGTEGPDWIDIASEGGFLPAPVVVPPQPTTWVTDPTLFNAGNVDQHSLMIAPAERHDAIVDFSQFAGHTLILYNDAPAAFPARDPRYDYFTGNADLRDTGGAPSTLPGYGPNTRTIMQIKIADSAPAPAFDMQALETAFMATGLGGGGVFETGQNPIIVGQGEYNSAYGTAFKTNGPMNGTVQIYDTSLTFETLAGVDLTMGLKPKMIQDEMGEAFEFEYGRMSGFLGVETPNAQAGLQNMILHGYTYPPDEILDGIELPPGVEVQPISSADDGTQIWKFTHNGVDTHPIHFHLYDVQLLNRVGWDGIIRKPDATELGWKDTVRISPLEDTIVAIRPIIPELPAEWGGLPNSVRLLDPSMPEGMYLDGANTTQREAMGLPIMAFNPDGEPVDIPNHVVNFGWEYVYHCHILSHEEMDMMHAQVVGIEPPAPQFLSAVRGSDGVDNNWYDVTWTDNSKNETAFVIERRAAGSTDPWLVVVTIPSDANTDGPGTGQRTYRDSLGSSNALYEYRLYAINTVGDTWDYSNPAFNNIPPGGGWPTLTLESSVSGPSGASVGGTDILALNFGIGSDALWYSTGTVDSPYFTKNYDFSEGGTYDQMITGDYNADGLTDILAFNPGPGGDALWYALGTANAPFFTKNYGFNEDGTYDQMITGDYNNDGRTDILALNFGAGPDALWYATGSASPPFFIKNSDFSEGGTYDQLITGDYNNDGRTDILALNFGAGPDALWYATGSATPPYFIRNSDFIEDGTYDEMITGDYNNDGRTDIVALNYGLGTDTLWYATGAATAPYFTKNYGFREDGTYDKMITGDFNNDGRTDILALNYGLGSDALWHATGTANPPFFTKNYGFREDGTYDEMIPGDFNSDGLTDILALNYGLGTDALWYATGTASPPFFTKNYGFREDGTYDLMIPGDFNHDLPVNVVANQDVVKVTRETKESSR